MRLLPNMTFIDEEEGFLGEICLEYWQSFFDLKKPIVFYIGDKSITAVHTDLYNYIVDNQKELLDNVLSEFVHIWYEWIDLSPRAKQYKNLSLINFREDIKNLIYPFYLMLHDEDMEGHKISFIFEPRKEKLKMFSQLYFQAYMDMNALLKISLELDNILYISAKFRNEKEEKWYVSNR